MAAWRIIAWCGDGGAAESRFEDGRFGFGSRRFRSCAGLGQVLLFQDVFDVFGDLRRVLGRRRVVEDGVEDVAVVRVGVAESVHLQIVLGVFLQCHCGYNTEPFSLLLAVFIIFHCLLVGLIG